MSTKKQAGDQSGRRKSENPKIKENERKSFTQENKQKIKIKTNSTRRGSNVEMNELAAVKNAPRCNACK